MARENASAIYLHISDIENQYDLDLLLMKVEK
jgi:hypothetical protein